MRMLKHAVAFLVVFSMLAVTVVCAAVVSDATLNLSENDTASDISGENQDENIEDFSGVSTTALTFTPRLTSPAKDNKYYYSDKNIYHKYGYGMPNCTCYAWGRAYEILKTEPKLCIHDAKDWFEHNKKNNWYAYGNTPKLGAILCVKYKNYDSGHVAVVEKIEGDTIYYSNSAWGGQNFYISTGTLKDPTGGQSNWIFQGFIYIGEFTATQPEGDLYEITSDTGVNLRNGAGTSYDVLTAIPYSAKVYVTKTKKADGYNWGYTNYNGKEGWFVIDFAKLISGGNVKPEEPTEPEQPVEPEKPTEPEPPTEPEIPIEPQPPIESQKPSVPEKPTGLLGDVDMDGTLTIFDATVIQRYLTNLITFTDEQKGLADFDNDLEISILDATEISRKLAGL